jgi:hypothetical protein
MNRLLKYLLAIALLALPMSGARAASVQPIFTNDTVANNLTFNDTFGHVVVLGTYSPVTGLWTAQGVAGGFTNLTVTGFATIGTTLGVTGATTLGNLTVNGTLAGSGVSAYFASPPPIGSTLASTGAFTTLSATGALSGAGFNGLIASPPVGWGSVVPNGVAATSLSASGTVSGTGFANYLLSPPAIGNTVPNTGAFTTLSATGLSTLVAVNSSGNIQDTGGSQAVIDLVTSIPANGSFLANAGAAYKNCPTIYSLAGNAICASPLVLQRSSDYFKTTTAQDASIGEYAVTLDSNLNSGKSPQWAITTSYATGNQVDTTAGAGNIYQETVASCTSAGSGTGPTGTGSGIADNTCLWNYIGSNFNATKVGVFTSATTASLGTRAIWATADDFVILPSWTGLFAAGKEIDVQNQSTDCALFTVKSCYGLLVGGLVTNPLTAYLAIAGTGGLTAAHVAVWVTGNHIDDVANFENSAVAPTGFCNGCVIPQAHTVAGFRDKSIATTPRAFSSEGTYSLGGFVDVGTGVVGIDLAGTYSLAAVYVASTATVSVSIPSGKLICLNGGIDCYSWNGSSTNFDHAISTAISTVAALPTCNAGMKGGKLTVSDAAAAPVYNATAAGGGGGPAALGVLCDGTNWKNE